LTLRNRAVYASVVVVSGLKVSGTKFSGS